jgi:hypothetical protein
MGVPSHKIQSTPELLFQYFNYLCGLDNTVAVHILDIEVTIFSEF